MFYIDMFICYTRLYVFYICFSLYFYVFIYRTDLKKKCYIAVNFMTSNVRPIRKTRHIFHAIYNVTNFTSTMGLLNILKMMLILSVSYCILLIPASSVNVSRIRLQLFLLNCILYTF